MGIDARWWGSKPEKSNRLREESMLPIVCSNDGVFRVAAVAHLDQRRIWCTRGVPTTRPLWRKFWVGVWPNPSKWSIQWAWSLLLFLAVVVEVMVVILLVAVAVWSSFSSNDC